MLPSHPSERTNSVTSLSEFQNCQTINFCCLRHLVCDTLLWQPQDINVPSYCLRCPVCHHYYPINSLPRSTFVILIWKSTPFLPSWLNLILCPLQGCTYTAEHHGSKIQPCLLVSLVVQVGLPERGDTQLPYYLSRETIQSSTIQNDHYRPSVLFQSSNTSLPASCSDSDIHA